MEGLQLFRFSDLPRDLQFQILLFANVDAILRFGLTSKRNNEITKLDALWNQLYRLTFQKKPPSVPNLSGFDLFMIKSIQSFSIVKLESPAKIVQTSFLDDKKDAVVITGDNSPFYIHYPNGRVFISENMNGRTYHHKGKILVSSENMFTIFPIDNMDDKKLIRHNRQRVQDLKFNDRFICFHNFLFVIEIYPVDGASNYHLDGYSFDLQGNILMTSWNQNMHFYNLDTKEIIQTVTIGPNPVITLHLSGDYATMAQRINKARQIIRFHWETNSSISSCTVKKVHSESDSIMTEDDHVIFSGSSGVWIISSSDQKKSFISDFHDGSFPLLKYGSHIIIANRGKAYRINLYGYDQHVPDVLDVHFSHRIRREIAAIATTQDVWSRVNSLFQMVMTEPLPTRVYCLSLLDRLNHFTCKRYEKEMREYPQLKRFYDLVIEKMKASFFVSLDLIDILFDVELERRSIDSFQDLATNYLLFYGSSLDKKEYYYSLFFFRSLERHYLINSLVMDTPDRRQLRELKSELCVVRDQVLIVDQHRKKTLVPLPMCDVLVKEFNQLFTETESFITFKLSIDHTTDDYVDKVLEDLDNEEFNEEYDPDDDDFIEEGEEEELIEEEEDL
eukprot:TRINITY_DN8753_c0_g1_i1.p1 TRINITY_DN8753_c0_g1~~TRINITY_DN8753_c0_g1_i1.p1  ORF type:complete len:617 (-),score=120.34 TRINITY_DN8753_c0_g1_i1:21-1871(-)